MLPAWAPLVVVGRLHDTYTAPRLDNMSTLRLAEMFPLNRVARLYVVNHKHPQ
jgi:hypothetical protein